MNGSDSSNLSNMNELIQLLSAMNSPEQSIPSLDSGAINSLDMYQDFTTDLYKINPQSVNSSTTSIIHDPWLNGSEKNKFDAISQLGTAHWVQQTRTPVTRSHSVIAPTLPTAAVTSQKDLAVTSSLPVCHDVKSQHRSLSRTASDPVATRGRVTRTNSSLTQSDSIQSNQDTSSADRYKTELCRTFLENGKCKYGDKCQFAHGQAELRNLSRHPKYKTDRCKTYHSTGFCPYGPRCHFVHDENEHAAEENKHLQQKFRQLVQQKQQHQQQQQQQQQLLLALLAQSQNNQSLGLSVCDLSGLGLAESAPSTSHLFNSLSQGSGKYSDSLGSTSSPPSSVSDSRPQSPTLSIFDGEQVDILASRSGSLDATAMVRKDLNEWQQAPVRNLLSGTRQNLASPPGFKTFHPNSLVYPNGYQQYQNTLSTSITNHSSPSCNLPTSESNLSASQFDAMTLEDVLLIAEVLKAVPTARGKFSAAPFPTLPNFDRLDALTSLAHFPSSGLVL